MLQVRNLEVVYDDVMLVLRGVSLAVPPGAIVALLGANGAGKTTLLRALTGLLDVHDGEVTKGAVLLDDEPLHHLRPAAIVRRGVSQVMEGRRIFAELSVEENLRVGGYAKPKQLGDGLDRVYGLFPLLEERRAQVAGYLSGGAQQMLAIGRALMSRPKLLMIDELSMGLAPLVVADLYEALRLLADEGLAVIVVDQFASKLVATADRAVVIEKGRIIFDGSQDEADTEHQPAA